jgi:PAS domain S-box-containing protein
MEDARSTTIGAAVATTHVSIRPLLPTLLLGDEAKAMPSKNSDTSRPLGVASSYPVPGPDGGRPAGHGDGDPGGLARPIEDSFRHFAESLSDLVWSARPDGHVDYYNGRFLDYLGKTQAEMGGWTWAETLHPDDADRGRRDWEDAWTTGAEFEVEFRIRRHDGVYRWHRSHGSPMRDEAGRIARWFGTCTDIEERKAAEEHLALQALVLESMTEGVSVSDEAGIIVYTNPAEDRLFGYGPGELVGRHVTVQNDYPVEENDRIVAGVIGQLKAEGSWSGQWRNRRKDGSPFWTFARITAVERGGRSFWVCVQEDITGRKHFEEERSRLVAASERQRRAYETVLSSTPDFNYVFDLEGRFTYVNAALLDLWRKPLDEAVGRDFFDLGYPPELAARLQRQIRQVIDTEQSVRDETPYTSHLGERQYEYIFVPVLGAGGEVEAVAGSTRDITERKRAEEALRESEERFRAAVDQAAVGVAIVGLDHRTTFANRGLCQMLGYTESELLAKSFIELTHPDDLDLDFRRMPPLLAGEVSSCRYEKRYLRRDGSVMWGDLSVSAVRGGLGELKSVVAVLVDTTERRRADQTVQASEERLRLALEAGRMGTWDWDIRTGRLAWSDNLEEVHGLPPGVFDGTVDGFRGLVHPDDRDRVEAAIARSIEEVSGYEAEFRILRPDGSTGWMLGEGKVFAAEAGGPARMIGVGMDITGRKRAEEALGLSEQRFARFMQQLPGLAWIKD